MENGFESVVFLPNGHGVLQQSYCEGIINKCLGNGQKSFRAPCRSLLVMQPAGALKPFSQKQVLNSPSEPINMIQQRNCSQVYNTNGELFKRVFPLVQANF